MRSAWWCSPSVTELGVADTVMPVGTAEAAATASVPTPVEAAKVEFPP